MPLIAWAVTRQEVARTTWIGATVGFVGVILVLGPQRQSFDVGSLSALAGALFLAVAMMSVRWLGATEPMIRVLFYYFLLSTVMAIPIAVVDWQPIPAQAWMWLAALGCAQLASQALIVLAYRYAPAEKIGPFIYYRDRLQRTHRLDRLAQPADSPRLPRRGARHRRRNDCGAVQALASVTRAFASATRGRDGDQRRVALNTSTGCGTLGPPSTQSPRSRVISSRAAITSGVSCSSRETNRLAHRPVLAAPASSLHVIPLRERPDRGHVRAGVDRGRTR